MLRRFGSVFSIAAAMGLALFTDKPLGAQTQSVITEPLNANVLVTLRGNTSPLATPSADQGPVPDSTPMNDVWLLLKRPPAVQQAFEQFLAEQQDPKSPNYHKWLTTKQMGEQFGPAPQDIATVAQWLESFGFTVNQIAPHGTLIDFSGTAGQISQAFHTAIHNYQVNGVLHFANASDPQIPVALQPVVVGPVSLHNFMPHPLMSKTPKKKSPVKPSYDAGGVTYNVVPGDLATIYNINPAFAAGYTGTGVTIVVVEDTDTYTTADFGVFRKEFGLARPYPHGSLTEVHPPSGAGGFCADPGQKPGNEAEAILDTEWSSAAAPNATIVLAACADTANFGGFIALENMLTNAIGPIPEVVGISYGIGELQETSAVNAYINSLMSFCAGDGVSVFVSSGDEGAAGGDALSNLPYAIAGIEVNAFASTPYAVAVGGTDYGDVVNNIPFSTYWSSTNGTYFNSALSYIQEIPWNNSCASTLIAMQQTGSPITYGTAGFCNSALVLGGSRYTNKNAGSGGPSALYTKPPFQAGFVGNPADSWRDLPDVSMLAASGIFGHTYVICYSDTGDSQFGGAPCTGPPNTWSGSGGTSVAAPVMAGIMALIDQKAGFVTNGLGNPLYRIYAMAGSTYGGSSLSDCNSSNGTGVSSFCIFYDITQGDNDVPCEGTRNCYLPSGTLGVLSTDSNSYQPAYPTGTGWDFATGIGSVNAFNFVTFY